MTTPVHHTYLRQTDEAIRKDTLPVRFYLSPLDGKLLVSVRMDCSWLNYAVDETNWADFLRVIRSAIHHRDAAKALALAEALEAKAQRRGPKSKTSRPTLTLDDLGL